MTPDDPPTRYERERVHARIGPGLLARIDAAAAQRGITRQQLIRDAIAAHLDRLEKQ